MEIILVRTQLREQVVYPIFYRVLSVLYISGRCNIAMEIHMFTGKLPCKGGENSIATVDGSEIWLTTWDV